MLDTNVASDVMVGDADVEALILREARVVMSSVTAAEVLFGVARKRGGQRLVGLATSLLTTFEALPWTIDTAHVYARVKADCTRRGKSIGALDMLIAAHAIAVGARLATRDKSFARLKLPELKLVKF
jgi:tRNA(fMet)-specific endonuclease VapC